MISQQPTKYRTVSPTTYTLLYAAVPARPSASCLLASPSSLLRRHARRSRLIAHTTIFSQGSRHAQRHVQYHRSTSLLPRLATKSSTSSLPPNAAVQCALLHHSPLPRLLDGVPFPPGRPCFLGTGQRARGPANSQHAMGTRGEAPAAARGGNAMIAPRGQSRAYLATPGERTCAQGTPGNAWLWAPVRPSKLVGIAIQHSALRDARGQATGAFGVRPCLAAGLPGSAGPKGCLLQLQRIVVAAAAAAVIGPGR
ncbi:hypothetical protein ONZ51_g6444 [Trametes cubensis]|uniref:Uncharacterized protein n=1 Tax=Trametes cubensis TaxID=1111947 RepID=A0AAD7TS30_9APHY|nr:hypothetical protein ONZ51_g6444 [Trametes cubensis]